MTGSFLTWGICLLVANGAFPGESAPTREDVRYVTLRDRSTFSVRTQTMASQDEPQTVTISAALCPEGREQYLGGAKWQTELGTLEFKPEGAYYALSKVEGKRAVLFLLWNRQHVTIDLESGRILEHGVGDEELARFDEWAPLLLQVIGAQVAESNHQRKAKDYEGKGPRAN